MVPWPPKRRVSSRGSPPAAGMRRKATSLFGGCPSTLLSKDTKTSHFPSGEGWGNQSA